MSTVIIIISLAIVVCGDIWFGVALYNEEKGQTAAGAMLALIGLAAFIFGNSMTVVPTGFIGVNEKFGQIAEQPSEAGLVWHAPFVEHIKKVCVKQQDVVIDTRIWGESADKTPVYAESVVVSYRINPEKVVELYKTVAGNNYITTSIVSSAMKSAMVELETADVTVRSKIEPLSLVKLNNLLSEKYGSGSVIAEQIIVYQMDFEDANNAAIAAKSIAKQTQERQAIENATAVEKAEADKKVAVAKAEADAQTAKIKAEADADVAQIKANSDAEVLRITAEAEAEANKKVAESLDENILKAKFYESWDGKLPSVMGEGTVITDVAN